jgi:hypothetical protein
MLRVVTSVVQGKVSYSRCKQKMTSFRGQANSANIMSLGDKLTALACHPTKRVNKAEELTNLSINIGGYYTNRCSIVMYSVLLKTLLFDFISLTFKHNILHQIVASQLAT